MANKKIIATLAVGAFSVAGLLGVALNNDLSVADKVSAAEYTLHMNNGNKLTEGQKSGKITTDDGYDGIEFKYTGVSALANGFATLANKGTIETESTVWGMSSIGVKYNFEGELQAENTPLKLSWGYEKGVFVREGQNISPMNGDMNLHNFGGEHPNYFRLTANAKVNIEEIVVKYSCEAGTAAAQYNEAWELCGGSDTSWGPNKGVKMTMNTYNTDLTYVEYVFKGQLNVNGNYKPVYFPNPDAANTWDTVVQYEKANYNQETYAFTSKLVKFGDNDNLVIYQTANYEIHVKRGIGENKDQKVTVVAPQYVWQLTGDYTNVLRMNEDSADNEYMILNLSVTAGKKFKIIAKENDKVMKTVTQFEENENNAFGINKKILSANEATGEITVLKTAKIDIFAKPENPTWIAETNLNGWYLDGTYGTFALKQDPVKPNEVLIKGLSMAKGSTFRVVHYVDNVEDKALKDFHNTGLVSCVAVDPDYNTGVVTCVVDITLELHFDVRTSSALLIGDSERNYKGQEITVTLADDKYNNRNVIVYSWGKEEAKILRKVVNRSFKVSLPANNYAFLIAYLKPGETTLGDNWCNVEIQSQNINLSAKTTKITFENI